ncbi:unnamed protein product [Trypanosoma congolense IL3000]|uniref:WGS project CAEQ00000000 data, annotated contig 354 n=1 Tax=Trypanosoma congolense (strain IL3000) TaxID=1068625 RepID=F9WF66_TRYCI|nr:unnamed protein product [Trypanosoma congolense IL3000]
MNKTAGIKGTQCTFQTVCSPHAVQQCVLLWQCVDMCDAFPSTDCLHRSLAGATLKMKENMETTNNGTYTDTGGKQCKYEEITMGFGTFVHLLSAPATAVTLAPRESRTTAATSSVVLAPHISCKSNLTIGPSPAAGGLGLTRVTATAYELTSSVYV